MRQGLITVLCAGMLASAAHGAPRALRVEGRPAGSSVRILDPDQASPATQQAIQRRLSFPHDLATAGAPDRPLVSMRSRLSRPGVLPVSETETLRVALIRVDFENDRLGESSTGDGRFDLRTGTGIPVDPPPHDRAYFEAHGEALARYYRTQSYGSLNLEFTVLPAEGTPVRLSDLADYGPWSVEQSLPVIVLAETFVTDALRAADAAAALNFSEYDAFVVVHAGADFQGDVNGDTPYDIPSFTLTLGDPINLSTGSVDRVLVLPETASQDGLLAALNGVFAHEFGHILGLPDLYNIFNGVPQVGWWSLMDSGENIVAIVVDPDTEEEFEARGIFPTSFDPWSKLQLFGDAMQLDLVEERWESLVEATQVNPVVPYVEIDPFEYFLVENRALDLDGNGFPFVQQDSLTGVFLGPTDDPGQPGADGRHEYDAVLPEGGVLIWHIDDRRVLPALADRGQVNLSLRQRGVAVEEADGIWDQGRFNFGRPEDPFYEGNNTLFGPETVPSSEANDGGYSGITIEVGGAPDRIMSVTARRTLALRGWPRLLRVEATLGSALAFDVNEDGADEFLFSFFDPTPGARDGIAAVDGNGEPIDFDPAPGVERSLFGQVGSRLDRGILGSDRFRMSDGGPEGSVVAAVAQTGEVLLWDPAAVGESPLPGLQFSSPPGVGGLALLNTASASRVVYPARNALVTLTPSGVVEKSDAYVLGEGSAVTAGPAILEASFVVPVTGPPGPKRLAAVGFENGAVEFFSPEDDAVLEGAWRGAAADGPVRHLLAGALLDAPEPVSVAVTDQSVFVIEPGNGAVRSWALPEGALSLPPVIGDVDDDGRAELAAVSDSGNVFVFNGDGSPAIGWPAAVSFGTPRDLKVVDLDGDGDLDLLVVDAEGFLFGFSGTGELLQAFHRSLGPFDIVDAAVGDFSGDGRLAYAAATGQAALVGQRLPKAVAQPGDWRTRAGNREGGSRPGSGVGSPETRVPAGLADESLMVYPNPSRNQDIEIRFARLAGETVQVSLIDVSGREVPGAVLESRGGTHPGENAFLWRVGNASPGLYICRVERRGPGGTTVETAKIALVR